MNRVKERDIHEVLELLWVMMEASSDSKAELQARLDDDERNALEEIKRRNLADEKGGKVFLTESGKEEASKIIRRHRLAEVLFVDLFNIRDEIIEQVGCTFEHILDEDVVDRVCTFLSHPPFCPHGRRIPMGRCCKKFEKKVAPLVQRLLDLKPGNLARIVFITSDAQSRLSKLFSLNIIPGNEVKYIQRFPSPVIKIGETSVAMDDNIAKEIFVIPKNEEEEK